eukprot:4569740-Pleurochrysis_carterae.AAC.1
MASPISSRHLATYVSRFPKTVRAPVLLESFSTTSRQLQAPQILPSLATSIRPQTRRPSDLP